MKEMELIVEPCDALPCELETFTINGKSGDGLLCSYIITMSVKTILPIQNYFGLSF